MAARSDFAWLDPFKESAAIVYLRNRDNVLLWVNDGFLSLFSEVTENVIGRSLSDLAIDRDHAVTIATRDRTINDQVLDHGVVYEEVRSICRNDRTHWFHAKHSRIPAERTAGHGPCVLLNAVDVTARVELAALAALIGMHHRETRPVHGDEAFVRLLLAGHGIRDLATALDMSVESVTAKLGTLAGTPIR
jgi:hypothetical protein